MTSPYLHALSCSRCGAALSAQPGQQLLTCQYCAQAHAFVPPPARDRRGTHYSAGERVAVEWGGHWWPATVLSALGPDEWRVHFEGWNQDWDVVVGPSRIRHSSGVSRGVPTHGSFRLWAVVALVLATGLALTAFLALRSGAQHASQRASGPGDPATHYRVEELVDIHYGATWYPGRVLQVKGASYEISYDGWSSRWNEWVDATRLRAREAAPRASAASARTIDAAASAAAPGSARKYRAGDSVQIEWHGSWYPGRILEVDAARYKITYDGWSSSWDEWVDASRLEPR